MKTRVVDDDWVVKRQPPFVLNIVYCVQGNKLYCRCNGHKASKIWSFSLQTFMYNVYVQKKKNKKLEHQPQNTAITSGN